MKILMKLLRYYEMFSDLFIYHSAIITSSLSMGMMYADLWLESMRRIYVEDLCRGSMRRIYVEDLWLGSIYLCRGTMGRIYVEDLCGESMGRIYAEDIC